MYYNEFLKITDSITFVLTLVYCFCCVWSCQVETFIFLVRFCYWWNSFMKGGEEDISNKAQDWNSLSLFKIQIKQDPGCSLIRISGPIPEVKKICIDHWLVKCCILRRIWAKWGVGEQVWFVVNTSGRSGDSRDPRKILQFF